MKKIFFFTLRFFALLPILYLSADNVHAQEKYFFERLSVSDGLSNSEVTSTFQDHLGFLWIGTIDGLNRYDGYDIKTYKNVSDDSTSLPNNVVATIFEDSNNDLWIGSVDQVFRYNRQKESFSSFNLAKGPSTNSTVVNQIFEDSQNRLWIATERMGVQLLDKSKNTISGINHIDYSGKTVPFYTEVIWSNIIELRNGDILGASPFNGVFIYNESSNEFQPYFPDLDLNMKNAGYLYEDKAGKLWIGAVDMIYIYGPSKHEMRSFDLNQISPDNTQNNKFGFFREGEDGKILFITSFGLIETDMKATYFSLISEGVGFTAARHLLRDNFGIYWISTGGKGLFKLDPSKKPFQYIPIALNQKSGGPSNPVEDIVRSNLNRNELIFSLNDQGLYRYKRDSRSFSKIQDEDGDNLLADEAGTLWFTTNLALSKRDLISDRTESYLLNNLNKTRNPGINNLIFGPDGKIWLLGYRGIETFDTQNETFDRLPSTMNKRMSSELYNKVKEISDSDEPLASIVEVGEGEYLSKEFTLTESTKLLLLSVGEGRLQTLHSSMFDYGSIEDENGNRLWASDSTQQTFHNGGGFKNRIATGTLTLPAGAYRITYQTDIGHNYGSFNVDSPPDSSWYGIQIFQISEPQYSFLEKQIAQELDDNHYPPFEVVFDVEFSQKYPQTAWIGSGGTGLIRLNLTDSTYTHYSFDDRDNYITSFNQLFDVLEDKDGILWLITRGGLIRFDPETETHELIDQKYGLSSNQVEFMIEDLSGNIWFGTPGGISMLDKTQDRNHITFINYDNRDGINSLPLNSSVAITEGGEIFYGGIGGLNSFFPGSSNSTLPKPVLTDLTVSGKSVKTIADEIGLRSPISKAKEITLPYASNNLSFEFASIHFSRPEKNNLAYMLEGIDPDWNYSNRRFASYLNLPPGDYEFKIKGSNGDGIWNPEVTSLSISITPPWWRSWWAYSIYGLLFISGIVAFDRLQRRRLRRKERERSREKELAQAKKIEEAYRELETSHKNLQAAQDQLVQQEKLASLGQLTAGIAHEIKNPLNFVNNFSELSVELIEETKEELLAVSDQLSVEDREKVNEALEILNDIDSNLRKIHQHGSRADSIVKSMLEHSRGGSGIVEPADLNALVKEYVNLTFHGMRAGKEPISVDIQYDLDGDIEDVPLIAEDFSRVIINLCNNAFDAMREKQNSGGRSQNSEGFTPRLTVRTKLENDKVILEIEDNRPGIPDKMKDKIMQPFFTTKKGTEGTGLGLSITNDIIKAHGGTLEVSSSTDKGTTFTIILPME